VEVVRKSELADCLVEELGLSKKQASEAVDAVLGCIRSTLAEGGKVALAGFGSFEVRTRKERMAMNPRTGERIMVPATKVPAFKAGKQLKDAVK